MKAEIVKTNDSSSVQLEFKNVTEEDQGTYTCTASIGPWTAQKDFNVYVTDRKKRLFKKKSVSL